MKQEDLLKRKHHGIEWNELKLPRNGRNDVPKTRNQNLITTSLTLGAIMDMYCILYIVCIITYGTVQVRTGSRKEIICIIIIIRSSSTVAVI